MPADWQLALLEQQLFGVRQRRTSDCQFPILSQVLAHLPLNLLLRLFTELPPGLALFTHM